VQACSVVYSAQTGDISLSFTHLLDAVLGALSEQELGTELELTSTMQTIPRSDIIQHAVLDALTQTRRLCGVS
jgi:2C-methyl-D-erythritol 2,4-cyclodiphosphate synthase